jgi:hypothetical protein
MLTTKPIAIKVVKIADNPALINGKGTPMTGRNPWAIPIFMNI